MKTSEFLIGSVLKLYIAQLQDTDPESYNVELLHGSQTNVIKILYLEVGKDWGAVLPKSLYVLRSVTLLCGL